MGFKGEWQYKSTTEKLPFYKNYSDGGKNTRDMELRMTIGGKRMLILNRVRNILNSK